MLLQPDAVAALDVEGARDLALADLSRRVGDEGDELVAGGEAGFGFRGFGFSWAFKLVGSFPALRRRAAWQQMHAE